MVGLMFFLQFSGINAVLSYLETIIRESGIDVSVSVLSISANCVQLVATFVAMVVVDRFGQPLCWCVSASLQIIAFILLALQQLCGLSGSVFICGLMLEQLGYGVGIGPVPFALSAQLFEPETVAGVMPIGTAANWITCAVVSFIWPPIQEAIGMGWGFVIFVGMLVMALLFGIFVIRGLPLPLDVRKVGNEP
jgi:MFS family permease